MTRLVLIAALAVLCPRPAAADVTVRSTIVTTTASGSATSESITYVKGKRMRADLRRGGTVQTTIYDLDAGAIYTFSSGRQEADVWQVRQPAAAGSPRATLMANGRELTVGDRVSRGYDLVAAADVPLSGTDGPQVNVTLRGPIWVAPGVPGADEQNRFYALMAAQGWVLSDPAAAQAQPGPARVITEMYRQLAMTGGLAVKSELELQLRANGAHGEALSRIGSIAITTTVDDVKTELLADDLFAPAAGVTLRPRT